jgi:hypothetical protein
VRFGGIFAEQAYATDKVMDEMERLMGRGQENALTVLQQLGPGPEYP